jgi:hypothetical protein
MSNFDVWPSSGRHTLSGLRPGVRDGNGTEVSQVTTQLSLKIKN